MSGFAAAVFVIVIGVVIVRMGWLESFYSANNTTTTTASSSSSSSTTTTANDSTSAALMAELYVNASTANNIDAVRRFLENGSVSVDTPNARGDTALHSAALNGHAELVDLLLARGADVNRAMADKSTPLFAATFGNNGKIALTLLERGARLVANDNGATPLHGAALLGDEMLTRALLRAGASVTEADENGITAMHAAAYGGNVGVLRVLRAAGARRNVLTTDKATPLHWCCLGDGDTDVVAELVSLSAAARAKDAAAAVEANSKSSSASSSDDGPAPIDAKDELGRTALHICAERGLNDTVATLLAVGADAALTDNDGMTALFLAFPSQHTWVVKVLLDAGAKGIDTPNVEGNTVLHWAAHKGFAQLTERLLNHSKAAIDFANNEGMRAVHIAASQGSSVVLRTLYDAGANVLSFDNHGMAVMHYGALMQNEYVTLLPASLDMALDTPTRDGNASLVLHLACRSSRARADFVKSLLDYGLAVDALDAHGRTPLHYCIQFANVDGVQELLTAGANLAIADKKGVRPIDVLTEKLASIDDASADTSTGDENDKKAAEQLRQRFRQIGAYIERYLNDE